MTLILDKDLDKHIVRAKKPSTEFGPSHWKYLFRLLGLVVVADKKVVPESVDAYVKALRELAIVIDPKLVVTHRMIQDWISLNKTSLIEMVDSLEYDTVLLEILKEIKFLPHKLDVITAMVRVAIADGNYSDMKQMFVKKTILYWNIHAAKPLIETTAP
ncbi:hypothetical protein DES40_2024 [Litorimonas taeanensis]|uniref:Tellurite resistance protein TerB n=1 Tax=Litorimonas taeanensis TaxID=568099 RepID=A0A420WE58_9PROT|nr:hypothetical protein [Litorimonas taeanensis]RKQ69225.1 hypothetical protein DES40_2024 [Litorimonas taeanensis]